LGMRNSKVPGHNGTLAAALKYVGYWGWRNWNADDSV
jgi:hypothetical protein